MMPVNFMRSAFRILVLTCFLLFIAWLSMQLMKYGGDFDKLVQELRVKAEPYTETALKYVNEKILPLIDKLTQQIQSKAGVQ